MRDVLFGWLLRGKCDFRLFDGLVLLGEFCLVFLIILFVEQKIYIPLNRRKTKDDQRRIR